MSPNIREGAKDADTSVPTERGMFHITKTLYTNRAPATSLSYIPKHDSMSLMA